MAQRKKTPNAAKGDEITKGGDGRYPRHLYTREDDELAEAGLARDHSGRIRDGREFVCAVSGRVHQKYLVPVQVPDPQSAEDGDRWVTIYVSGHEVRPEIRRTLIDRLVDVAGTALSRRF